MKRRLLCFTVTCLLVFAPLHAADDSVGDAAKSLDAIASDVHDLLLKEKVYNQFDLFRRLKDSGVTWQPALLAPNDLAGKLDAEQLRFYAGAKLFDTIYAASFLQRQAVVDSMQALQDVQDKLDLRSHADLTGAFFKTLKDAFDAPDSVEIPELLERLAADYVRDIPALMATPEGAEFLIDSLYGFTIETSSVLGHFYRDDPEQRLRKGMRQDPGRGQWLGTMVSLFEAFDRSDEAIRLRGRTFEKLEVIEHMVALIDANTEMGNEDARREWQDLSAQVAEIRESMLNPDSDEVQEMAKSLEQVAAEVREVLVKEKIHGQFDALRQLKEIGITWQPSLTLPNDLIDVLDEAGLRFYAGAKMSDAIYAATFMQRQAVADSIKAFDAVLERLDVRSHVDLSGNMIRRLREAANEPESVDLPVLLEQLSEDLVGNLPALMGSWEGADFLIDAMYGFTIQSSCIVDYFFRNDPDGTLYKRRQEMRQKESGPGRRDWIEMMLQVFEAYDRMGDKIQISGETAEKVEVFRRMVAAFREAGNVDRATNFAAWDNITPQLKGIRETMLCPATLTMP